MIAFWLYIVLSIIWLLIALLILQSPVAIIGWIMIIAWVLVSAAIFIGGR